MTNNGSEGWTSNEEREKKMEEMEEETGQDIEEYECCICCDIFLITEEALEDPDTHDEIFDRYCGQVIYNGEDLNLWFCDECVMPECREMKIAAEKN